MSARSFFGFSREEFESGVDFQRDEARKMPFDLVDLSTCEIFGPFATHAQARAAAKRSGFKAYAIWAEGERVELVGPQAYLDERQEQVPS